MRNSCAGSSGTVLPFENRYSCFTSVALKIRSSCAYWDLRLGASVEALQRVAVSDNESVDGSIIPKTGAEQRSRGGNCYGTTGHRVC